MWQDILELLQFCQYLGVFLFLASFSSGTSLFSIITVFKFTSGGKTSTWAFSRTVLSPSVPRCQTPYHSPRIVRDIEDLFDIVRSPVDTPSWEWTINSLFNTAQYKILQNACARHVLPSHSVYACSNWVEGFLANKWYVCEKSIQLLRRRTHIRELKQNSRGRRRR